MTITRKLWLGFGIVVLIFVALSLSAIASIAVKIGQAIICEECDKSLGILIKWLRSPSCIRVPGAERASGATDCLWSSTSSRFAVARER
jgi:hypothetical protein